MSTSSKVFTLKYQDTVLYFGKNALKEAVPFMKQFKRFGLITGKHSAKVSGALDDVLSVLKQIEAEYVVYDDVTPNPWASQAERAGELMWREGVEVIVAIGGGSIIDTAKAASLIATGGKNFKALVKGYRPKTTVPLIAINLTHGTGTEIDRYAVLTTDDTREKHGLGLRYPTISIDDPAYTVSLPRDQTIYTSFDAFYHAYEAATSTKRNLFVDSLSRDAISIIKEHLPLLVKDLVNIEKRAMLLYASMIAGIAIDSSSTHLNHALEHVLSGLQPKLPHGLGLTITGPRFIYYTHKATPVESARLLKPLDPSIKPLAEDAEKAMRVVKEFQESLGITQKLSDYGFTEKDFKEIYSYLMGSLKYLHEGSTPFPVTEEVVRDIILHSL